MSAGSRSSDKSPDCPFSTEIETRARRLADRYQIVLAFEDGEWYGHALELPGVFADGATPDQCVANTREALTAAVAVMMEEGDAPPAPARQGVRSEQVNVRLTPEERALLETRARQKGFRGLSDFIRAGVLAFTK